MAPLILMQKSYDGLARMQFNCVKELLLQSTATMYAIGREMLQSTLLRKMTAMDRDQIARNCAKSARGSTKRA